MKHFQRITIFSFAASLAAMGFSQGPPPPGGGGQPPIPPPTHWYYPDPEWTVSCPGAITITRGSGNVEDGNILITSTDEDTHVWVTNVSPYIALEVYKNNHLSLNNLFAVGFGQNIKPITLVSDVVNTWSQGTGLIGIWLGNFSGSSFRVEFDAIDNPYLAEEKDSTKHFRVEVTVN